MFSIRLTNSNHHLLVIIEQKKKKHKLLKLHFLVIHSSENSFKFYSRNIQLHFFPRSLFSIFKQFGKVKFKFKGTLDTVYILLVFNSKIENEVSLGRIV